jgi:hypothetical protein
MSEALIREIAEKIAHEQLIAQWPIYLLMAAISLIIGFLAPLLNGYAKKRGETLATKADFEELLTQLKTTTAVAEEVKVQVSHADWAAREYKTIRRSKLEELLQTIHEAEEWLYKYQDFHLYERAEPTGSLLPKIERLSGLYFAELKPLAQTYCQLHRSMVIDILNASQELIGKGKTHQARLEVDHKFRQVWQQKNSQQLANIAAIEDAASRLMTTLVGAPAN